MIQIQRMKFYYFFLILIFSVNTSLCQDLNLIDSFKNSVGLEKDSLTGKNLASIKQYLILKNHSDTTYVDTSLTIKKFYKFNFLRSDNFEKLKFSNLGQTYNSLTSNFQNSSLPDFSLICFKRYLRLVISIPFLSSKNLRVFFLE